MAIIHYEHFDLYGTNITALSARGYDIQGGGAVSISTSARTGSHCFTLSGGFVETGITHFLPSGLSAVGQGCALLQPNASGNTAIDGLSGLNFGTDSNRRRVRVVPNQQLGITILLDTTVIATSLSGILSYGSWFWLEASVVSGTGTGAVVVRLNGVEVVSATGLNLPSLWNSLTIGKTGQAFSPPFTLVDDWLAWDTSGTTNNSFIGDTFVIVAPPNADATPNDWVPSSGSSRFELVNETDPNDAGRITANNVGDAQEFGHVSPNLPIGAVTAIATQVRAFKTDTGASSIEVGLSSNGATSMSGENALATGVLVRSHIANINPDGNQPWTQNAAQAARLRIRRIQ